MKVDNKFKEAYASLAKDRSRRDALASLIVEYIKPNHITWDVVGLLLNTRAMKPGDALVKKVRKGLEVRTLVPGSIHLASEITVEDRINYMLDGADIRVRANLWELESGELGTVQSIRQEMMSKLADYYLNRVFSSLSNVWSAVNTVNNYTEVATITATALEDAIDEINYRCGSVKTVIGTRKALSPITKFGNFVTDGATTWGVDSAIEEIRQTGWLGKYYGCPIVGLDQVWDNLVDYNPLLPENKILVIGHDVGEFITYGEPRDKNWEDMEPTPPYWNLEIYQQFGFLVDKVQGIYVIKLTG